MPKSSKESSQKSSKQTTQKDSTNPQTKAQNQNTLITPRTLSGFRDYLPKEAMAKDKKQEFNDIKINGDNRIEFTIPPCSVMHIKVVTE